MQGIAHCHSKAGSGVYNYRCSQMRVVSLLRGRQQLWWVNRQPPTRPLGCPHCFFASSASHIGVLAAMQDVEAQSGEAGPRATAEVELAWAELSVISTKRWGIERRRERRHPLLPLRAAAATAAVTAAGARHPPATGCAAGATSGCWTA